MSGTPRRGGGLRLIDLTGLVVGFGLASLLMRGVWPMSAPTDLVTGIILVGEYLWLGMAMSGPIVLLFDGRARPGPVNLPIRTRISDRDAPSTLPGPPGRAAAAEARKLPASRYTRAELAWLSIGAYWMGMAAFVVPGRAALPSLPLFSFCQILAALGLWVLVPKRRFVAEAGQSWTHRAAIVLLWTWPIAWGAMVLLSLG